MALDYEQLEAVLLTAKDGDTIIVRGPWGFPHKHVTELGSYIRDALGDREGKVHIILLDPGYEIDVLPETTMGQHGWVNKDAIEGLKRGDCWCDVGIGHPLLTQHSAACQRIRVLMGVA